MNFPSELKYTKDHEWIKIDGDTVTVGITDYAQDALGDIVFLELPEKDSEFSRGDTFGVVESVKAVSDLYAPLSGTVIKTHEPLVDEPEAINEDPYEKSWMITIKVSNPTEQDDLMDAAQYEAYVKEIS
ncbi:MAG: glycine cleavage system protein GcvH [Deltaproteobacteria bacterium]|nr:glycine cleavage system protein GcvH [Deltaproteobacteria bacterium]